MSDIDQRLLTPSGHEIDFLPSLDGSQGEAGLACDDGGPAQACNDIGRCRHKTSATISVASTQAITTIFGRDRVRGRIHGPSVLSSTELLAELRRLRDTGGTSNADIARLLKLPSARIAEIFDGKRRITIDEMKALVEHFEIAARSLPVVIARDDSSITLKQIDLGYSMGPGANIDDYIEEGTFDIDAALLRSITRSPPESLYVARGEGDSMFPTLQNGDTLLIDTLQTQLNLVDRVWCCSINGGGAIKRLRPLSGARVMVKSDNPIVGDQEVAEEEVRIMGRVIWVGRRI